MRKCAFFWVVVVILAFQVGTLTGAQADVAGRLTQVVGRVDILKKGQLPATPAKIDDGVETGDVIRTKCSSKAQITFIDNSTLTISPEARVAIEDYMFDPAKQKRNAVLKIFQGLAHVVVNKVYEVKDPDFIVKTNTAIMGVRGTEFGIRIQPNSSTILNLHGRLQVGNIFPEVSQLSRKAVKVAYSFGPGGWVMLGDHQVTTVASMLPPTVPLTFDDLDWNRFKRRLIGGLNICRPVEDAGGGGECGCTAPGSLTAGGEYGSDISGGKYGDLSLGFLTLLRTQAYTPPTVQPTTETSSSSPNNGGSSPTPPTPTTYNFSLTTEYLWGILPLAGFWQNTCGGSALNCGGSLPVCLDSAGRAVLDGDLGTALYCVTDSSAFTTALRNSLKSKFLAGLYTTSIVGSVSGESGDILTGTATLNSSYISLLPLFSIKKYTLVNSSTTLIQVTIDPSGVITYSYQDGSFEVVFKGNVILTGTSFGEGTASPGSCSTTEGSETMTMAASSGSTVLMDNSQPEVTDAPAIGDKALGSPAATLSNPEVGETAGSHRRCGIKRDFCSPRGHKGGFDFGSNWNSCNQRGQNGGFGFGSNWNFCSPRGHDSRCEHHCAFTPRTQHCLANLTRTGPMIGGFGGPGPGPTIANFIRHCPITNPTILLSRHCPGNPCQPPGGVPCHQGGPQVTQHQKPKPAVHQQHGPCGPGPGGPHGPNLPGNPQHIACGPGPGGPQGPNLLGNPQQPPCGQVNRGPQGPNPPGPPGNPGPMGRQPCPQAGNLIAGR